MNIKAMLAFDGTAYHGWQIQNNAVTVQELVTKAIKKTTGEAVTVTGCSRTDAGVHALNYCISFESDTKIPLEKLPAALNARLPRDIRIYSCESAASDFHARFSAKSKTYIYKTVYSKVENPFLFNYAYHFSYPLDFDNIRRAAQYFIGTHDFSAFMATGGSQKTTVRTVNSLEVRADDGVCEFEINANAYLYNMVRIISGTLLYTGCGRIDFRDIPDIIKSGDRRRAGITAPACGLYLKEIFY